MSAPLIALCLFLAADWRPLLNGKNLDDWQVAGESVWTLMKDGTLIGQRPAPTNAAPFGPWPVTAAQYRAWRNEQSWLYTRAEFRNFDLHLEYWVPPGENSGISLRDSSRGMHSFGVGPIKTPANIGYEIQILGSEDDKYLSGSVYLMAAAPKGLQVPNDWNSLDIEARTDMIRVRVNGHPAAEHATDPARPQSGPIGLQLHDRYSFMMFRNVRIREIEE